MLNSFRNYKNTVDFVALFTWLEAFPSSLLTHKRVLTKGTVSYHENNVGFSIEQNFPSNVYTIYALVSLFISTITYIRHTAKIV